MLNAYVDGELTPAEVSDVARAAGDDPAVAEQIALLYKVKSGAHAAVPPAPEDLASVMPPHLPARFGWRRGVAAAVLVLAVLLAGALWWSAPMQQPASDAVFASARALHERWLLNDKGGQVETTPVVLAAVRRFGALPVVPDLESTGLEIATVGVFHRPDKPMLQIGYRGHHGCHLSLFVVADRTLANSAGVIPQGLERTFAWQVGDLGYLLYALGMDQGRFDLIAEKVESATRTSAPLSVLDQQQLAANHLASARCKA